MFLIYIYFGFKIKTETTETEPKFFETETYPAVRLQFLILKIEYLRFRLQFYSKTTPIPLDDMFGGVVKKYCYNYIY